MTALTATREGRLGEQMEAEARAIVRAQVVATKDAIGLVKTEVRARVRAGLPGKGGARHVKAIRSKDYENEGRRTGFRSIVYSVLGRGKGDDFVDYLAPHVAGAVMRPKAGGGDDLGKYMVMPVKGVSRRLAKDKRALGGLGTDPRLELIPITGGRYLFVRREGKANKSGGYRAGARATIIAILVRRVTMRRRVDMAGVPDRGAAALVRSLSRALGGADG